MKLFRHYKDKTYRYLGTARHSETLEELVLYECRYENDLGRTWVRPSHLFFGSLEIDGRMVDRFHKVELRTEILERHDDETIRRVSELASRCWDGFDAESLRIRLGQHARICLIFGQIEGQDVAFKLGYPENATDFYSWLGGVVPEYRGVGIAADLMDRQHRWCQAQGFLTIRTKCFNSNRAMLLANLKWGFLITGTEATAEGLKLWLEKELVPQKS